jgi:hypothetical protein
VASELGPHMKLLDSAIDAFLARFGNAARLLAEQLDAQGVRVWLSAGCLTEFAEIARLAAGHSRQVEESYGSCIRRPGRQFAMTGVDCSDARSRFGAPRSESWRGASAATG